METKIKFFWLAIIAIASMSITGCNPYQVGDRMARYPEGKRVKKVILPDSTIRSIQDLFDGIGPDASVTKQTIYEYRRAGWLEISDSTAKYLPAYYSAYYKDDKWRYCSLMISESNIVGIDHYSTFWKGAETMVHLKILDSSSLTRVDVIATPPAFSWLSQLIFVGICIICFYGTYRILLKKNNSVMSTVACIITGALIGGTFVGFIFIMPKVLFVGLSVYILVLFHIYKKKKKKRR